MKRIEPPKCTCCGAAAQYESELWPTTRLCHQCWKQVVEYILDKIQVVDGNPFLIELLSGTDNGETKESLRFWRQRPGESSTYYEYWVRRTKDSGTKFKNQLDNRDRP